MFVLNLFVLFFFFNLSCGHIFLGKKFDNCDYNFFKFKIYNTLDIQNFIV